MPSKSHAETRTVKVGDVAPDFTLRTGNREEWHLADFRGKKNVVLAFVPFAFSGVCSTQLPSYEAELERFKDVDTEVVSISMDSGYALNAWAKSMGTSFPLLSDFYPQGKIVDLYGALHAAGMPDRAIFGIDKEGVIRFIQAHDSPGHMPDNENLFQSLRQF